MFKKKYFIVEPKLFASQNDKKESLNNTPETKPRETNSVTLTLNFFENIVRFFSSKFGVYLKAYKSR